MAIAVAQLQGFDAAGAVADAEGARLKSEAGQRHQSRILRRGDSDGYLKRDRRRL